MSSMCASLLSNSSRAAFERQLWGEFFGDLIRSSREERNLSIEEAARGAGMSASEWESIEAGTVPRTREQLQALAAGLGLELEAMVPVVLFCQRAW
jgi:transcriptional regulator with XRE-family HTH domain